MKTRMIAVTAAILLAAASLIPMAGAETVTNTETAPAAITETVPAEQQETVTTPTDAAATPTVVEEQTAKAEEAELVIANVKTHHRFTEVASRFQVKVGKVSPRTKVCMWATDCRKANTMMRRLSSTETLTVVAQSNGWYKVVDSNGVTGFVVRSRVTRA